MFAVEQGYIIASTVRSFDSARRQIHTRSQVHFLRQLDILIVLCHLGRCDDETVPRLIILNLHSTKSALQDIPAIGLTHAMRTMCTASPRKNWPRLRVGRPSSSKSGPHTRSNVVIPLPVESLDGPFGLV